MPPEEEHERLSNRLGKEIDQLGRETQRVEDEIKSVRADWRAKQHDSSVPGATVPGEDEEASEGEGHRDREEHGEQEGDRDREEHGEQDTPGGDAREDNHKDDRADNHTDDRADDDEDVSGDRPDPRSST